MGKAKLPRRFRKALNHTQYSGRMTRALRTLIDEKSIAHKIYHYNYCIDNEFRGYKPDKDIEKHRLFKVRRFTTGKK